MLDRTPPLYRRRLRSVGTALLAVYATLALTSASRRSSVFAYAAAGDFCYETTLCFKDCDIGYHAGGVTRGSAHTAAPLSASTQANVNPSTHSRTHASTHTHSHTHPRNHETPSIQWSRAAVGIAAVRTHRPRARAMPPTSVEPGALLVTNPSLSRGFATICAACLALQSGTISATRIAPKVTIHFPRPPSHLQHLPLLDPIAAISASLNPSLQATAQLRSGPPAGTCARQSTYPSVTSLVPYHPTPHVLPGWTADDERPFTHPLPLPLQSSATPTCAYCLRRAAFQYLSK